jgi:hypothetical protein
VNTSCTETDTMILQSFAATRAQLDHPRACRIELCNVAAMCGHDGRFTRLAELTDRLRGCDISICGVRLDSTNEALALWNAISGNRFISEISIIASARRMDEGEAMRRAVRRRRRLSTVSAEIFRASGFGLVSKTRGRGGSKLSTIVLQRSRPLGLKLKLKLKLKPKLKLKLKPKLKPKLKLKLKLKLPPRARVPVEEIVEEIVDQPGTPMPRHETETGGQYRWTNQHAMPHLFQCATPP